MFNRSNTHHRYFICFGHNPKAWGKWAKKVGKPVIPTFKHWTMVVWNEGMAVGKE